LFEKRHSLRVVFSAPNSFLRAQ